MIAGRAILKVNDSEYDILRFNHKFERDVDAKGRPCSNYYGGEISVTLESTDSIQLFQQMIHKDMPTVNGSIEVLSGIDEVCIRRIDFKEAYIYSYEEQMQATSPLPMTTTVAISPMRLDFNKMLRLDRLWPRAKHGWQKFVEEDAKHVKGLQQASSEIFDEQIRVVDFSGAPIADLLYYVEYNGREVLSGRTTAEGLTERIESGVAAKEYTVYWGEDALIKIKNSL